MRRTPRPATAASVAARPVTAMAARPSTSAAARPPPLKAQPSTRGAHMSWRAQGCIVALSHEMYAGREMLRHWSGLPMRWAKALQ